MDDYIELGETNFEALPNGLRIELCGSSDFLDKSDLIDLRNYINEILGY